MGASAHRRRLFWTNMLAPATLEAALPRLLPPSPPLSTILNSHHIPTKPGYADHFPFVTHNLGSGVHANGGILPAHQRLQA